jgi:hypothetical protein
MRYTKYQIGICLRFVVTDRRRLVMSKEITDFSNSIDEQFDFREPFQGFLELLLSVFI